MNDEEKDFVAHHEAGHALLACLLPGTDPVRKVSMIPRGIAALGYTMQMPTEDRYLLKKGELLDRLTMMLGGRSAEEVVFGEVSTGAHNDLKKATELAREMVTEFGMSEELGPLSYSSREGAPWSPDFPVSRPWSEQTARYIDHAVRALVESAHKQAVDLLTDHKEALLALAAALREKEVIDEAELHEILGKHSVHIAGKRPKADAPVSGTDAGPSPEQSSAAAPDTTAS
jgi:cell division protease FtsH